MKTLINKSILFTSKYDSQTIRIAFTVGSLIIFSLIAGAPVTSGGGS
ncbi:MAG: hypothetical protein JEZ00_01570 [Anaerolineaceae bacterium]|nr:hypothetical protein [Anaerolineaceae bacterium]